MKLRIAICDDEPILRDHLAVSLKSISDQYELFSFSSGEELLLSSMKFHVIFLDMQMQGLNGLKTAEQIRRTDKDVYIVFLTGFMDYIQSAFKVNAYRYLTKPLQQQDLEETMSHITDELINVRSVIINEEGNEYVVNVNSIICLEAYGDGTYIFTKDNVFNTHNSLKYWLQTIDSPDFMQVHRGYAISFNYYVTMDSDKLILNGMKHGIPVARRNRKKLQEAVTEYVKRKARYI